MARTVNLKNIKKKRSKTPSSKKRAPVEVNISTIPVEATKEKETVSASILSIPKNNERIVAVEDVALGVVHNQELSTGNIKHFTITPVIGSTNGESIEAMLDMESGLITTQDAVTKLNSIQVLGKDDLKVSTTPIKPRPKYIRVRSGQKVKVPPSKSKGYLKSTAKIILKSIILAIIISMIGRPVCNVMFSEQGNVVAQPHDVVNPALKSIIADEPNMCISGLHILQAADNAIADSIKQSAKEKVAAAARAYAFGQASENARAQEFVKSTTQSWTKKLASETEKQKRQAAQSIKDAEHILRTRQRLRYEFESVLRQSERAEFLEDFQDLAKDATASMNELSDQLAKVIKDKAAFSANFVKMEAERTATASQLKKMEDILSEKSRTEKKLREEVKKAIDSSTQWEQSAFAARKQLRTQQANDVVAKYSKIFIDEVIEKNKQVHDAASANAKRIHEEELAAKERIIAEMREKLKGYDDLVTNAKDSSQFKFKWAAPHIKVIRNNRGQFKVVRDTENLKKFSAPIAEVFDNLAQSFEDDLNGNPGKLHEKPTFDITVRSKTVYSNWLQGFSARFLGYGQKSSRYRMMKVASGKENDGNNVQDTYFYIPDYITDIPEVKEALKDATAVQQSQVETDTTVKKDSPIVSDIKNSAARKKATVSSSDKKLPVVDFEPPSYTTDEKFKSEEPEETQFIDETFDVPVDPPSLVVENVDDETIKVKTYSTTLSIITKDFFKRVTVCYPDGAPQETEAADVIDMQHAGQNEDGDKIVSSVHKETDAGDCFGGGLLASFVKSTMFCVDSYISRLQKLKDRRTSKIPIEENDPNYTVAEKTYVSGSRSVPFSFDNLYIAFGDDDIKVQDYFSDNNVRTKLEDKVTNAGEENPFSRDNFLRAMEYPERKMMAEKDPINKQALEDWKKTRANKNKDEKGDILSAFLGLYFNQFPFRTPQSQPQPDISSKDWGPSSGHRPSHLSSSSHRNVIVSNFENNGQFSKISEDSKKGYYDSELPPYSI